MLLRCCHGVNRRNRLVGKLLGQRTALMASHNRAKEQILQKEEEPAEEEPEEEEPEEEQEERADRGGRKGLVRGGKQRAREEGR